MDSNVDYENIARQYASQSGYDSIRAAGERNGQRYFRFFNSQYPRYTGLPKFLKISAAGIVTVVQDFNELMWATHQEVLINNLGNRK